MLKRLTLATTAIFAAAAPAFAHVSADHLSMTSGMLHPLSGADHLLAMLAVGIWAAQLGGKAKFAAPAAFVTMMLAGFGLAVANVALPFVEPAILASLIGLGLLVALAVRVPVAASAGVVAVFALFHGYAHGAEFGTASALTFAAGFAISTAALHATGFVLARLASAKVGRALGVLTAIGGAVLAFG